MAKMFKFIYAFEGLDDQLSRPPLAALRALQIAGVLFSPQGWDEVPLETREGLTAVGGKTAIDREWVLKTLQKVSWRHVKLWTPRHFL